MKPIKFKGCNIEFAKNQPPYLPLPACRIQDRNSTVVCCWQASFLERIKILLSGKLYLSMLSFGKPLTPNRVYAENPIKYFKEEIK